MDKPSETDRRDIDVFAAFSSYLFWDQMNLESRGQLKEVYSEIVKSSLHREYLSSALGKAVGKGNLEYNLFRLRRNISQLELEYLKN